MLTETNLCKKSWLVIHSAPFTHVDSSQCCMLVQGWANIFCGGPHWRFYCYRGLHARITYITYTITLVSTKWR